MVPHRGASCPRPLPNAEKKKKIRNTPRVARKSARPSTEVRKPRGAAPDVPNGTQHPEHPRTPARSSQNTSPSTFLDPPAQAAASGILVACVVAAAVAPFSTVGPGRAVDRETAVMMREHMGSDDADPPPFADHDAVRLAPLTPGRFARAARAASPVDGAWPSKLVVVPAVFDEWDVPEGASVESSVPAWARPDPVKDPYVVSDLYQRRFEAAPGFVPNRASETAVYLKFVVDHYENLPDVTAFVRGDFHRDVADAKQRLVRVANRAAGVAYQPLDIPETTKDGASSRSDSSNLARRANSCRCGRTSAGGGKASWATPRVPPPRTSAGVGADSSTSSASSPSTKKEEEETRVADVGRARGDARRARRVRARRNALRQSELGQFFYPTSGGGGVTSGGATSATFEDRRAYPVVSEEDKAELAKSPVTVSAYRGGNFAVSRERLTRVPLETWKKLYDRLVTRGECLAEGSETTPRDEIRDSFDLGVGLEHLSHVIFGGERADAGEAARCCGATCVLRDATCDIADEDEKDGASDDAMRRRGERLASHMEAIEAKIARHNGWDLVGLRAERAAMDEADASDTASSDSASDSSSDKVSDKSSDIDYPIAAVGAAREEGPTRGDAGWRKILDGEKAKISAGRRDAAGARAADAVAKKKLEIMLDDALREADRLREQVRQLDGDEDVSEDVSEDISEVARLSANERRDDEFESILSVAKSTFEAQEREKRALKESIDTLKRDDEETRRALEAKLDALEEDVKRKKEVADALRLRVDAAVAGSEAAERDSEKNRKRVDQLTEKLANAETRLTRVRERERRMEEKKNIAARAARQLRLRLNDETGTETVTETGTEAKTTATSSAAPDDFVVAAVGLKRAKASEKTKAKASVPVEKKGAAKKTAKPAAVPEKKAPAVGKKTSESADARKAERRAKRAAANVGTARDEAVAKLAMPRRGHPKNKAKGAARR